MTIQELEWKTRKERIDKKLKSLSQPWNIIRYKEGLDTSRLTCHAVEEYPTANGPADYALFVKGQLLGILEAKKVGIGPQNVLNQAKRYSQGAFNGPGNWNGYRVPFLYATNGEVIYHLDVRHEQNLSRQIAGFHTADALEEMLALDKIAGFKWFTGHPIVDEKLREYQKQAIAAIEKAIGQGKREMLVAMATGTGKTYTTVNQIYRMLESKAIRRVLFLVDRRALAAQAVREFASYNTPKGLKFTQEYDVYSQRFRREDFGDETPFDPKELPEKYLTAPNANHTFVYVATIQRMAINLLGWENAFAQNQSDPDYEDDDTGKLDIPIHAFDVIIADECHRGYTANETGIWRNVMNYFDAIKIGLTATPASHTLALFREVVYRYTTEQAILDGFLVDYDAVKIKSGVLMDGVFLKEGETVGVVDTDTGREIYDELEDERVYPSDEVEKKITAPDCNRKIVKEIAKYAYEFEQEYGRFPKILIFAANDLPHTSHADQLVRICREEFGQGEDLVAKITGSPSVDRPLQLIRKFRNRPNPKVVVTVDMLSTGVDIPSLEFIVFLRPVKSRILWVQMLGRGTRRCPEIYKSKFTVFDCFNGTLIEYFKNTNDFHLDQLQKETISIAQVIENIYQNIDREYFTKVLVKRLRRIEKNMSAEARRQFMRFIPGGDMNAFASGLAEKLATEFTDTMKLLRDKEFQDLLVNYPRAKRSFLVGYEVVDQVASEVMIRVGGDYQKPEDYLDSFARFVKDNPEHIQAIQIILERPKEWRTNTLIELRNQLAQHEYPEEKLRRAFELTHHNALADIISMVKHAAKEEEPLLTAEQRVDKALQKVTAGKSFTEEQLKWLDMIRLHLIKHLTIDLSDFEAEPIFERAGGKKKAEKVFGEELTNLLVELNTNIAA